MTTDSFTGRQGDDQYVKTELVAKKDMYASHKWRVRKDRGYEHRQDLYAKICDKYMLAPVMRGDGEVCVKFSTPEDYEEIHSD